jgi:alpha-L-rhamnosidase
MSKPFDNAVWIWDDGDPAPVNAYRYFRKEFDVAEGDDLRRTAHVCAETRYELHLNGQSIACGPAPSAPGRRSYDEVELNLAVGKNRLAIVVSYVGVPLFYGHSNRAGVLFAMGEIVSDKSWLISKTTQWRPSPRLSIQQGFAEFQDARLQPSNVFFGEIDPEDWLSATEIASAYAPPWEVMEERDIPLVAESFTWQDFQQLIGYGNCRSEPSASVAERLENERLDPLSSGKVELTDFGTIDVAPGDSDIWLLFDMGREVSGTVDLDIDFDDDANSGVVIDVGYDEALRPGETPSGLKHGSAKQSNEYADQLILGAGDSQLSTMWPRAFRYVRLAVRGLKAPIEIAAFGVHETVYPVTDRGVFACSEPRLDRMFEIGRRTLLLCMEDRFMDCPQRERAQWIGDARIQAIGARYCFGDSLLHRRFLRQTALSQYPDGRIDPVGPGGWDSYSPNNPIPGFVAIFIQSALDYYEMTGDGVVISEIMPALQKALGWMGSFGAGEGGLLTDVPGWNFTDWAPGLDSGNEGETAAVNLFYLQALRAASQLAEHLGDAAAAISCSTRADMVAAAFDSLFWNALRGVYVDAVVKGEQSAAASQQVNTMVLLSGIGSEGRRLSVVDRIFTDRTLTQIGSPYFSYYLVQALALCDKNLRALDYIRKNWGAMMDAGATTWWETWDGKNSRCHAWSIAPTIWLPQHILGVTAHEPGFDCVNVAPRPCDLQWARGIVPIPQGDVVVSWVRSEVRFILYVTIPTGVHLRPILPCAPGDKLIIDGEPVDNDSIVRRSLHAAELAVLPGSGYRFEVVRGE